MSESPSSGASSSESPEAEIAALDAEAARFRVRQKEVEAEVRRLRDSEDLAAGVCFAQEIFTLSQEKMRLEVEAQLCSCKANRLRLSLGADPFPLQ